jgi:hypothetical protein
VPPSASFVSGQFGNGIQAPKGVKNKPVTVKLAMKTFTGEQGAEMLAFASEVMALPNWLEITIGPGPPTQHQNQLPSVRRGSVDADTFLATGREFALSRASAFSSQYVMPISRYIVVAVVRCSCASCSLPVRR